MRVKFIPFLVLFLTMAAPLSAQLKQVRFSLPKKSSQRDTLAYTVKVLQGDSQVFDFSFVQKAVR